MPKLLSSPLWLALFSIAFVIIVGLSSSTFNAYYLGVTIDIGIAIILAVSLNLINGHTGQFNLGHAAFMSVGAYIASLLTFAINSHLGPDALDWLFLPTLISGGLVAACAGLILGIPSLRLKGDYLAIVTLGFGEIVRVIFQNIEAAGGASGLSGIPRQTNLTWTFVIAIITVYTVGCIVNSTYGRGFIAVKDDEIASNAMGLNPTRYKITAFVISAFFAGIAGGLYAHHKTTINPGIFDYMKSFDIVAMVILGGMGRTSGVILAAILLTLMPEVLRPVAEYRTILFALMIIVIMIMRPQGLFNFRTKSLTQS